MNDLLPSVLSSDVLADFLSVDASSLGVDVYLVILGDSVKEVLEVGPHLHHDQILAVGQSLKRTVDLGDYVVFRQLLDSGCSHIADLVRVQDGVVEVENDHRLLLVEQLLDVLLLLLAEQLAADEHVLGGLLVEEVTAHLADVLLGHLLHAELASPLHHLLVPADHPPQTHHHGAVVGLALVLLPLYQEGGLG